MMTFYEKEAVENILNVVVRKCCASDAYVLVKDITEKPDGSLFPSMSKEGPGCDSSWNSIATQLDHVTTISINAMGPSSIKNKFQSIGVHSLLLSPIWKESNLCEAMLIICNSKEDREWSDQDKKVAVIGSEVIAEAMRLGSMVQFQPSSNAQRMISNEETADLIVEAFNKIRKSPKKDLDQWQEKGRERFKSLVLNYVRQGLPVPFVMPAFPFKSRNTETKVTGPLPDKGEELALETLANFTREVKNVYSPGAEMLIISDGHVFNDIYEITDDVTTEYRNKLLTFKKDRMLQFLGFDDFFHPGQSFADLREKLMLLMAETQEVVAARIKEDPAQNSIYCGMKRFMEEEFNHATAALGSKTKLVQRIKAKCRNMMLRNEAYSNLIQAVFPNHIRLSIHPHSNVFKFGVNLIGNTFCGSPWHNVAVFYPATGTWAAMKLQDATSEGYLRTTDENGLAYFLAVESKKAGKLRLKSASG